VNRKITVLGAGSWGTALAASLAHKGRTVTLWGRDKDQLGSMAECRENLKYLPGVILGKSVSFDDDLESAVSGASIVVSSVTSQSFREVMRHVSPFLPAGSIVANTAKGLEQSSHRRLSQVAAEEVPQTVFVTLSGPSHAEEVGRGMPTTLVSASVDMHAAEFVQDIFMSDRLRIYTNPDLTGVELGGALKNIIALGAGISDGMGFGDNAKAAMMTRGIAEMSRLGIRMGAKASTFSGLSGIGDLIVTCTSMHSRNRRCGILIGQGIEPSEAVRQIGMVVEGVFTTDAAYVLSKEYGVEMPITEQIYRILKEGADAKDAVLRLMTRGKKHEQEEVMI